MIFFGFVWWVCLELEQMARLFGPAIFEASKLKVLFLGVDENKHPGNLPRTYTLTHSDITAKLTLAISQTINNSQVFFWSHSSVLIFFSNCCCLSIGFRSCHETEEIKVFLLCKRTFWGWEIIIDGNTWIIWIFSWVLGWIHWIYSVEIFVLFSVVWKKKLSITHKGGIGTDFSTIKSPIHPVK